MEITTDPATEAIRSAIANGDVGSVIRLIRRHRGMTQAQLGTIVGYSPSAISRLERGRLGLRDVTVLRRLASALKIRPELLGVSVAQNKLSPNALGSLSDFSEPEGGSMRRRRLLLGAAGFAGRTVLSTDAFANPVRLTTAEALADLERACLSASSSLRAATPASIRASLRMARHDFATGEYSGSLRRLTNILEAEQLLLEPDADRSDSYALLAHAYALATEVLVKVGGGATTLIVADRAVRAARTSGSAFAFAAAARQLATVLRHDGRIEGSIRLATEAADGLRAAGIRTEQSASVYARSLCTTAYIVASAGQRDLALDLVRDAAAAAYRVSPGQGRFDLAGVTMYSIGVHYALGDAAAAVTAASQIRVDQLPTPERRARYWCDVARAWSQYGDRHRTYAALTAAFREAPSEVRDRSSIRGLVTDLVAHDRRMPGLRGFAARLDALA